MHESGDQKTLFAPASPMNWRGCAEPSVGASHHVVLAESVAKSRVVLLIDGRVTVGTDERTADCDEAESVVEGHGALARLRGERQGRTEERQENAGTGHGSRRGMWSCHRVMYNVVDSTVSRQCPKASGGARAPRRTVRPCKGP